VNVYISIVRWLILNSNGDIGVQIDDEENADRILIVVGGGLRIVQ
jgi:hypothetical protein